MPTWQKLTAALVACAVTASGAAAQTRHDHGLWLAAFGNGKFPERPDDSPVRWWLDAQLRLRDDTDGFNQSLIRPGLGYAVDDRNALWAGYAWVRTARLPGDEFDEHRTWQQWTYAPTAGDWSFLHRGRFEQRLVETGSDVGLRWRQFARAERRLDARWSLVGWDEAFVHLNDTDWGARAGFDQNRAFVGFGFRRGPDARARIEIGYLNQFIYRRGGLSEMNHIISLNLFF